jgi:hypothetical protein
MPIIKARSSSIMDSVDLRGQPTAPTAAQSTNTNQLASTAFVREAIAELIDSSPALLDTLNELAAAIDNDPSFATTVANSIATKVALDGSTAMTGELTLSGDPLTNLGAVTKQYVDNAINAQMIYSTDDVAEGTTNLYYTDARVRSAWSLSSDNTTVLSYNQTTGQLTYNHPTSDGVLEGNTNLYFSQARARQSISMNSDDGTIISYSSITGEITFTTPNTDKISEGSTNIYFTTARARNSISNGSNIDYDSATGIISTQAAVWSVNGQEHDVVLDTDDVNEGSANLYFTNTRARSAVSLTTDDSNILSYNTGSGTFTFTTPTTDAIDEGQNNLYYTDTRVRTAVSASGDISYNQSTGNFSYSTPTTDGITEGSNNLYYTDARARNSISLVSDNSDVLSYDNTTGQITFNLGNQNTDQIAEGTTNLYFTQTRARDSISVDGWSNLSYNSTSGVITISAPSTDDVSEGSNLYYTQARARGAVSVTDTGGDGSLSYDSATGVFTYTGPDSSEVRAHFSAFKDSGDGNLSYSSSTGVFTYTGPTNSDYRQAVSANAASGDGDLSYDSSTGVFTYDGPTNADYRGAVSATKASGDGNLQYNSSTGVFTYTGPSDSEVRAHFSAATSGTGHGNLTFDSATGAFTFAKVTAADVRGDLSATSATGITYDSSTGTFSLASVPNSSLANSDITVNGKTISLGGSDTLNTDDISEGSTNKYYTTARTRADLSATDVENSGSFSYSSSTGEFSFDATGVVATVNGQKGYVTLDTDDISEGSTNKYYTTARTRADVSGGTGVTYTQSTGVFAIGQAVGTTDNVTFNDVTVSGDLTVQGTLTAIQSTTVEINDVNLTLAKGAPNAAAANGAGLTIDGAGAVIEYSSGTDSWNFNKDVNITGGLSITSSLTAPTFVGDLTGNVTGTVSDLSNHTTDDVAEGASNLYFTDARAAGAISLTSDKTSVLSYNSGTGAFTFALANASTSDIAEGTNLYFTDQRARDSVAASKDGGDGSFGYDSSTGVFTYTGPDSWNYRQAISATNVSGDGSISYNNSTGVISYTGPSASEVRAHFSAATQGNGHGDLSYDGSTGTFTLTKVSAADIRGEFSANVSGGDGNFSYNDTTGTFTYTGPDYNDYRQAVSATSVSGDGSISYDNSTGVFTYTGPSDSEVRAHFSADNSSGAQYNSSTGVFSLSNIPNSSIQNTDITINGATVSLGGSTSFGTNSVAEEGNLYYTDARARQSISLDSSDTGVLSYNSSTGVFTFNNANLTTDEVAEGTANLYFTNARARDAISLSSTWSNVSYNSGTGVISVTAPTSDDVTEGGTNLYFQNSRARQAISLTTDNTDAMSYDSTTGTFTFTLNSVDTDEIAEGATNKYFTTARARDVVSGGSNIDYDATTGIISTQAAVWSVNGQNHTVVLDTDNIDEGSNNLYFTDARARSAITLTTDDSNILSYNTGTGALTWTTPSTDAIAEGAVNLYYTDARADGRIAAASIRDLSDVNKTETLQDGYTLVWSSMLGEFVPQNVAVTATTLNFTGDGSTTSFSTGVNVTSIDNTQVYINGLIQAPTYSYTLSTTNNVTSIVFDTAPETNDYIFVRVSSTATLTAGGVLNESSTVDGGTY